MSRARQLVAAHTFLFLFVCLPLNAERCSFRASRVDRTLTIILFCIEFSASARPESAFGRERGDGGRESDAQQINMIIDLELDQVFLYILYL